MMLQEAGEFAGHLKKIEKDIRGLKNATESEQRGGESGRVLPPLRWLSIAIALSPC
jgi:hypothetical protein